MSFALRFIFGLLSLAVLVSGVIWIANRTFRRSGEDRATLTVKWIVTLGLVFLSIMALPWFGYFGLFLIVGNGVVFSLLWAPNIGEWLARPLTTALDGGSIEPEKKPLLSFAEAQRKRGNYAAAAGELRKQLEQFPRDYDTLMLLASVQAENLGDLESARTTIARLVNQTEHLPKNRAFALTQLADWELSRGRDPEAARQVFERIIQLFPDSEMSTLAAQRIAHLPPIDNDTADSGAAQTDEGPSAEAALDMDSTSADARADALVRHLAAHPLDADSRETLARLYAEELQQVDLALQQLETLIAQPNRPPKMIARWLNQLADIQLKHARDLAAAKAALQRIVDLFPGTAHADAAAARQETISVDLRPKEASRAIKLGSYQNDLGLKS